MRHHSTPKEVMKNTAQCAACPFFCALQDPGCVLSSKNLREPEILDVRPVTHLEELAVQPRVCLQVGWGGEAGMRACLQVGVVGRQPPGVPEGRWGRQGPGCACR